LHRLVVGWSGNTHESLNEGPAAFVTTSGHPCSARLKASVMPKIDLFFNINYSYRPKKRRVYGCPLATSTAVQGLPGIN
jgi:hypothetical protein